MRDGLVSPATLEDSTNNVTLKEVIAAPTNRITVNLRPAYGAQYFLLRGVRV